MARHQHHRNLVRIALAETVDDLRAGLGFVVAGDGFGAHHLGARDVLGEVVRVGGAVQRDRHAGLRPGRGIGRMGVNDPADSLERSIEGGVGLGVRRGPQAALHDLTVEVDHHHVGGRERVVRDATGLDREERPVGIERRDVAEGIDGEALARDLHVRPLGLFLQIAVDRFHLLEAQSIRGVVPAQLVLEGGEIGVVSDAHALDSQHAGQIGHLVARDRLAE